MYLYYTTEFNIRPTRKLVSQNGLVCRYDENISAQKKFKNERSKLSQNRNKAAKEKFLQWQLNFPGY